MKLTSKEKFNEIFKLAKQINGLSEMYSESALFVENKLDDSGVKIEFTALIAGLTRQLDALRKEAKE